MNIWVHVLLLLPTVLALNATENENCKARVFPRKSPPAGLNFHVDRVADTIFAALLTKNETNVTEISQGIFGGHKRIKAMILTAPQVLVFNVRGKPRIHLNETGKTGGFWRVFRGSDGGWSVLFKDCYLSHRTWIQLYTVQRSNIGLGLFVQVFLDRCDPTLENIFGGPPKCDTETTYCVPEYEHGDKWTGYSCLCKKDFYHPDANYTWHGFPGEDIENGLIDSYSCEPCPSQCDCKENGVCSAKRDVYLRTVVMGIQLTCMGMTVIMALVVLKQRKCKTIASGMWTILETILFGSFLLHSTVIVHSFEPTVLRCLLEPWAREMGFIICYGAIILKLYRHLIEFRTRRAHRWVVKDTDLLKYLLVMVISLMAYMSAYTSISLNFLQENYSLLYKGRTNDGLYYKTCKPLWWDYVTEIGEMTILIFGIHLSYASRNARTQFHERRFLCAAICIELAISGIFYVARVLLFPGLHPDVVLVIYSLRTHLTATLTLLLVFVPKFWYQQKQVRSLGQEYSCRLPVDAFKDVNAHGPLTGNNSDVDVGEVTLADMSPDDIRAELKRLYLQLEIFKSKTICRDNPHISKRRGGRKAQHRRFSLQNLYGKHRAQKQAAEEVTEAEPSRTPEDSVCSVEGPSAIYNDLPSTATAITTHTDHKQ